MNPYSARCRRNKTAYSPPAGRFFHPQNLPIKIVGKRLDKWGSIVYHIAS